jgi:predicted XRE-type DNA-binding protein
VVYAREGYPVQGYLPERRKKSVKLREWLAENQMTQEQFTGVSGIGQSTISRLCLGGICSSKAALKIYDVTEGAVTPNDIFLPAEG